MNDHRSIQVREGDLVAGKYRIGRVLGVGGMGVVVAAQHEQLEQTVAIKFVRGDALDNDEAVERFLREARSAARLRSEHVARVLDVGRLESGAPYMVMEFLEGSDLAQALAQDGPMAVDLAAALMLQTCEAVAEAHAAGIVHRDLKPENLFLTRTVGGSPRIKVLDFGVSKSTRLADDSKRKLTGTRAMLGSPLYMAPEQMRSSRDVDARTDVWSLGVVLFELLTARSPFEAETMPDLCIKIVNEAPTSLASLRPVLPPGLAAVVERCLEKDPNRRYANAAELAVALEPFAPPRSAGFSARPAFDAMRTGPLGQAPFGPPPVALGNSPTLAAGPQTPSIPAWGTEGRASSQLSVAVAATVLVLGFGAIAAGLRWSANVRHAAGSGVAAPPPPPAVDLPETASAAPAALPSEPPALASERGPVPAVEAPLVEAAPAPTEPAKPAPSTQIAAPAVKRSVALSPPPPLPARPLAPQPTPGVTEPASSADEDIPSLR